jgi:gliding motility-associated lipoprotein GldD
MRQKLFFSFVAAFLFSCEEEVYTPKPRAYFRIDLPAKKYELFNPPDCPFSFEYPSYARIHRDTVFFDENVTDQCWFNIDFETLGGIIHVSYKPITREQTLYKLREDAHKLTFKHTIRADYIDEQQFKNIYGCSGIIYDVGGNAASNVQFFITDSSRHYLRGALYFSTVPNADSLLPVIRFVREDMVRLIETFRWKS